MLNKPEILAPAGDFDAVKAAVKAGADACYVGGSCFSARAFAGNFQTTELLEVIDYCHMNQKRIYMAVNTLLKNTELSALADYIRPFYEEGIDGIIVQDTGVIEYLLSYFPDLPLHGSTQMSISSSCGAEFLKQIGLTRIVPARELSLHEITAIKEKVNIEIEIFVHGAMCFAYSGKCLLSSFAGGRSGNRGRCAQPCRKRYYSDAFSGEYVLSMKDMCTLSILDQLVDAGVDSFKIEGRMKKPEYVAATVQAYKEVRDACLQGDFSEELAEYYTRRLSDIYNRGGFTGGYYYCRNGKEMLANKRPNHTGVLIGRICRLAAPDLWIQLSEDISPGDVLEIRSEEKVIELTSNLKGKAGDKVAVKGKEFRFIEKDSPVYRTRNQKLLEEINKEILEKEEQAAVTGYFTARVGEPFLLHLTADATGVSVCEYGDIVERAQNSPVTRQQIIEKLSKTGGTGVALKLDGEAEDPLFIRIGSLNQVKRNAIAKLKEACIETCKRKGIKRQEKKQVSEAFQMRDVLSGCTVHVTTAAQFNIVNKYEFVDTIIIEYNVSKEIGQEAVSSGRKVILALPYIFRENRTRQMEELFFLSGMYDGILVRNLDAFAFLKKNDYQGIVVCDPFMYVYNAGAVDFYRQYFEQICFMMPAELTKDEMQQIPVRFLYRIYGYQPVMVTAQCFVNNYYDACGFEKDETIVFFDEKGNRFTAKNDCGYCYSVIYNTAPTDLIMEYFTEKREGQKSFLLEFTIEDPEDTEKIMETTGCCIRNGYCYPAGMEHTFTNFTRGHYIRGID